MYSLRDLAKLGMRCLAEDNRQAKYVRVLLLVQTRHP